MDGFEDAMDGTRGIYGGADETRRERKVLRAEGRGVVSADPDRVVLTFGVKGRDASYGAAVDDLNRRVGVLRGDLVEAAGIEREFLKTLDFDVKPQYDYGDYGREPVFRGYEASHRLTLELELDKDLMNRALDRVAGSASEATLEVSFDASDKDGLRRRALRAAVEDARGIAGVLAEAAAVTIEGIERIEHGRVRLVGRREREFSGMARARYESDSDPDIEPRALEAEVGVSIVYRIS